MTLIAKDTEKKDDSGRAEIGKYVLSEISTEEYPRKEKITMNLFWGNLVLGKLSLPTKSLLYIH